MNKIGEMMGESKQQSYVESYHNKLGYQNTNKQANHKLMRLSIDIHKNK